MLPPGKPETVSIHSWPNIIGGPLIYLAMLVGIIWALIRTHRSKAVSFNVQA